MHINSSVHGNRNTSSLVPSLCWCTQLYVVGSSYRLVDASALCTVHAIGRSVCLHRFRRCSILLPAHWAAARLGVGWLPGAQQSDARTLRCVFSAVKGLCRCLHSTPVGASLVAALMQRKPCSHHPITASSAQVARTGYSGATFAAGRVKFLARACLGLVTVNYCFVR
jgi:hypothetical protein